jgi:hypothetical protein
MPEKQYIILLDIDARKGALTLADDDINENWEIYREKFLRGDFP